MAPRVCRLERRPVFRHLDYRWQIFGVGFVHLGLAALPALAWAAMAALASPDGIDASPSSALALTGAGAAVAWAFAPLVPQAPRAGLCLAGAAPGALLAGLVTMPPALRAALPLWPALSLWPGCTVAMMIWQHRKPPESLRVAVAWAVAPRRYLASLPPRRALPPPMDVALGEAAARVAKADGAAA